MSGRKECYVTMTSSEAARLRSNAQRAQDSAEQAIQREQRMQNALNAANREREALNANLKNEIAGLHDEMKQMANEQNRRFMEKSAELDNVKQQYEKNRQELQNQINGIGARIEAKEKNAKKLAEFWISQTQVYFSDIEQYRHEMFSPGSLQRLKGKLEQMLSDVRNGMYEAAIATARALFNDAVDLKELVLNAETEWLYYHGLFTKALAEAESNLNSCEKLQFTFDMEHGKETVDAKVNYWTNGSLDEVSASISGIKQKTAQIKLVSTQQLINYLEALNSENIKMEAASGEAKEAIILSQNRAEIANKIADALEDAAWKCEDIVYEGGEFDQSVHLKMSDGMGNEIVAIITPEINTQNMSNKLELHFFDQKNDEKERQKWIASIENGLKQEGLEAGKPQCVKGYEVKASDKIEVKDTKATAKKKIERVKTKKQELSEVR